MKRKIWVTAGIAAALAFLIAFGAVGCVVSGFDLPLDSYAKVVLICGAASVFCAAAFSLKWGGAAVLCALALGAGYVWKQDEAAEQLFGLLYRMTSVYGNAYGWDPVQLADGAAAVDIPMAVLGVLLSAAVTWSVCRKLGAVLPVAASLIPLSACMVVTDTVPDVQYLFCLLFGLIILILTGRVRRQSAPQGNRLTAMAAIPAALALAAVFLTFPQESYVNRSEATRDAILSWFQSIPEKVAENVRQEVTVSVPAQEPDHVRLASLGRRTESPITVMEVTAEIGGTLYLRGQDYDGYDGMTWTVSQHRTEDFSLTGEDYGEVSIRTVGERALLYLPYYPARSMALIGGNMSNTWAYTEYVIPRAGLPDDWRARAISGSATPPDLNSPYLALPDATRARAEVLLADILGGASSTVEKAEKIGDYVRASARYDLNPSRIGEGETDFALWFLEDAEAGYCVHFATAAAVLLRDRSPLCQRLSGENRPRHARRRYREKRPRMGGILRADAGRLAGIGGHSIGYGRGAAAHPGDRAGSHAGGRPADLPGADDPAACNFTLPPAAPHRIRAASAGCAKAAQRRKDSGRTACAWNAGSGGHSPAEYPHPPAPRQTANRPPQRPGTCHVAGDGAAVQTSAPAVPGSAGNAGTESQIQSAHADSGGTGTVHGISDRRPASAGTKTIVSAAGLYVSLCSDLRRTPWKKNSLPSGRRTGKRRKASAFECAPSPPGKP